MTTPPNHWSQFWQQGHITTFGAALADNYEGPIKAFWLDQFAALPDQAQLLDVATGNGALALLAAQWAATKSLSWHIDACDLAAIRPGDSPSPLVTLHPGVNCEALPFADASYDLVSSQYGVEYSDKAASLSAIYRVLKPGGRFAAICHHRDSYTLQASRRELDIYRQGLDKNNVFRAVGAWLQAQASGGADVDDRKQAVNYAVNRLREGNAGHPCCEQMVAAVSHAIRAARQRPLAESLAELEAMHSDFSGAYLRLQDLSAAAQSAEDMQGLVALCRATGFSGVELGQVFHAPGQLAGFSLIASR